MPETKTPSEREVRDLLCSLNIPCYFKGFPYLVDAILLTCAKNDRDKKRQTMALYEKIAEKHRTTPSRVERTIRTAIKKAPYRKRNGDFIYWAAFYLQGDC